MTELKEAHQINNSNAVKPKATLSEITFSSGNKIEFDEKEKVILVGPNNSGKSQSLRGNPPEK